MRNAITVLVCLSLVACKKEQAATAPAPTAPAVEHEHRQAAPPKRRIDPGARRITADQQSSEKALAAAAIGPQRPLEAFGQLMKDGLGRDMLVLKPQFCSPNPDGSPATMPCSYYGKTDAWQRRVPYALAPLETNTEYRAMVRALHGVMDNAEHRHCAQAFVNRLWEQGEKLTDTIDWTLILHASGKDGRLVIDDVEPLGKPAQFAQEDIDCHVSAFRGLEVEGWTEPVNLYFEWPVCINPPTYDSKEGRHDM